MKITARAVVVCFVLVLAMAVLRITQPASPPNSPGASFFTVMLSLIALALTVIAAWRRSTRISWVRKRSLGGGVANLALATVPSAFLVYATLTGWIRLIGRYGKVNDYSVATSPIGYWGTFTLYAVALAIVLSWAFAHLRHRDAA